MDLSHPHRHVIRNKHRTLYKLHNIAAFGTPMHGAHPDVARPEFHPLERSRAWREFIAALDRALAYSWRRVPSLFP